MKNIEGLFGKASNIKEFSKGYFEYLTYLLDRLDSNAIAAFIDELKLARKNGNTVFFIGNGGSATTASHMVNDIALGLFGGGQGFRALALTDNMSSMTAIANDYGYDNVFIRQLRAYYREGDKLVIISASGNSPNVITAGKWAKKKGGKVIGLTGFDGGRLKDICDIVIHVKTCKGEYGPTEDIHGILGHLIYTWLWYRKRHRIKSRHAGNAKEKRSSIS